MRQTKNTAVAIVLLGVLASCTAPAPRIDTAAAPTFDGLHPVSGAGLAKAWAKRDLSLVQYDAILPGPTFLEFRAMRDAERRARGAFPVSEDQKARLLEVVRSAFRRELERSRYFSLTDEPGPTTLVLRSALTDIVSHVPPEPSRADRGWIASVGEATLVLELRDSQSGEILARAIDRRRIEPTTGAVGNTPAARSAEVRRVSAIWAGTLRRQLDALRAAAESAADRVDRQHTRSSPRNSM